MTSVVQEQLEGQLFLIVFVEDKYSDVCGVLSTFTMQFCKLLQERSLPLF